jgi:hypothetical protein
VIYEKYLPERIAMAERRAKDILDGTEVNEEAITYQFRLYLSKRLYIGIFDSYFENLTFDQLALEYYFWREIEQRSNPEYQQLSHVMKMREAATSTGGSLFGDEQWEDLPMEDQEFIEKAKKEFFQCNQSDKE